MTGPNESSEHGSDTTPPQAPPPGHFLTPELESDCARFLQQVKELAARRAEAVAAARA